MTDKSPWKSTVKIETVGVPAVGKFVEGTVATVYAVTDHTDLCKRLRNTILGPGVQEAAAAIERLEADNAALRELLKDVTAEGVEHSTAKYTVVQLSHNLRAAIDAALLAGEEKQP